jgi:hypothetical protein
MDQSTCSRISELAADEGPMELVILFLAAVAMVPASKANRQGHTARTVGLVFALHFVGGIALVVGFFALLFHGYVEDAGMGPANTAPVAIPVLILGAAMVVIGRRMTTPSRRPSAEYRCPICNAYFDELEEFRAHRRSCSL